MRGTTYGPLADGVNHAHLQKPGGGGRHVAWTDRDDPGATTNRRHHLDSGARRATRQLLDARRDVFRHRLDPDLLQEAEAGRHSGEILKRKRDLLESSSAVAPR